MIKMIYQLLILMATLLILQSCATPLRPLKPTFTLPEKADQAMLFKCATDEISALNERFKEEKADDVADIGTWAIDHIDASDQNQRRAILKIGIHPNDRDKKKEKHELTDEERRQYYNEIELRGRKVYLRTWAYEFPPIVPNQIKKNHDLIKKNIESCLKRAMK